MPSSVAVIVEWENALLSDLGRARRMLRRLGDQAMAYARNRPTTFELIVVYNPRDIDVAVPELAVAAEVDTRQWPGTIRMLAAPDLHYYNQKNFGATQTEADVVVFLDSDVIPDDGWLRCLLDAMDDSRHVAVGGETYMSRDTFLDRVFATFWIFEPRRNRTGVYDESGFFANNVAFKRDFFLSHRFPEADCYRGQCTQLARSIRRAGFVIKRHGEAYVSHPAPRGFKHVVSRAVCHGYDKMYWLRRERAGAMTASPAGAVIRFVQDCVRLGRVVPTRARQLRTGPLTALTAAVVAPAFRLVILASETVAYFNPRLIRSNIHL